MCSKIAISRWSLAAWLTFWLSMFSMVLVAAVTAYSYFVLTSSFEREDQEFLRGRVDDVIGRMKIDADPLSAIVRDWSRLDDDASLLKISMRLLSRDGEVLAMTPGAGVVPWANVKSASQAEAESQVGDWHIMTRSVNLSEGAPVVLQATLDRRQEYVFLSRYRKQLYLMVFVAAAIAAAGGYYLMRRGLRPLGELSSLAAGVGLHHMHERLDASQYSIELAEVARTFNAMLDRIEQWFDRLNRFSGDIAHELRTPLHNLRSEVEVVLQKPRATDEYQDALGSCLEEASRLSQLVDSLLFLARSESPQAVLRREPLQIRDELQTIQDFYEAVADEAGVLLRLESPALVIHADRTLFQRALGNLVMNAIAHTPRSGEVMLTAESFDSRVHITVRDTGCGIDAAHLPHVFDRLYQASESRGNQNFGLGLPIVKSVLELHGGSVNICSVPGQGTTVVTQWPVHRPAL